FFFFFQAEDGIRDLIVTGVQTCALPIYPAACCFVALLRERRLDAREQRVSVPQRRRLGVAPLLGDEQAARPVEVVVLVESERRPIERVARAGRVGVATVEIAVQVRGAGVVPAVECLPRG